MKPGTITYEVEETNSLENTSAGRGYRFSGEPYTESLRKIRPSERYTDFAFNPVSESVTEVSFLKVQVVGRMPDNCEIETPWFEGSVRYQTVNNSPTITQKLTAKTARITVGDLKSFRFKSAQKLLQTCFDSFVLIFKSGTKDGFRKVGSVEGPSD